MSSMSSMSSSTNGRRRPASASATSAAATALLLATTARLASALDADCQHPNSPPYSGFSLKIGTNCASYVNCQNGIITSRHTCPSGLLFNGKVGEGGICDWASSVECRDDALSLAFDSLTVGGNAVVTATTATPGPTGQPTPNPTPNPTQPTPANANAGGTNNNNNNAAGGGNSGNDDNPDNYYCGTSMDDAATCSKACPSGQMSECGDDFTQGCFINVTACASAGGTAGGSGAGTSGSGATGGASNNNADTIVNGYTQQTTSGGTTQQTTTTTPAPQPVPTVSPTLSPTLPPWTNAPFAPSPTNTDKTVIGYYASWQWYDRNKLADPVNVDFTKYDRINYAFFQPDEDGNLYGTDEWADPQLLWGPYIYNEAEQYMSGPDRNYYCSWDGPTAANRKCNYHDLSKGILHLAKAAGAEVMPSIGGWTLSDNFPGIAADAGRRENLAQQCVDLIMAYGFDGIDIDWEYPGYEDHSGTPADTVNFTLLLQAVRSKLDQLTSQTGKSYGLTAALPCGPDKIDKIQVDQIKDILTELNLMSYDMHGAWDALTGINAPMVDQGWGDTTKRWSVHGCVNNYVELGVPLHKMNIGLPFYGRSFRDATGMKQFHKGADDINFHLDEGSPQYFNIVNDLKDMTTYRHANTETQYAAFDNGSGLVSYDDPRAICDKVDYANARGMHGFLVWEISGDMIVHPNTGQIITPLIDATNAKIKNPNYNCDHLRDPLWALQDMTYRYAPPEPATVDWSLYDGPTSSGSGTDFDGAQESRPAPTPTAADYVNPTNTVYVSSSGGDGGSGSGDCPPDYTGYFATRGCTHYVYCTTGSVVGAELPCNPGTKFDVTIGVCTWEEQVQC